MSNQPEALRLADWLDDVNSAIPNANYKDIKGAADELRRLFQLAHDQHGEIYGLRARVRRLEWELSDLLIALKDVVKDAEYAGEKTSPNDVDFHLGLIKETARAAIAKGWKA